MMNPIQACELNLYPVHFGVYTGSALQARGAVLLDQCADKPATVHLGAGLHSQGQFAARAVSDGAGHRLNYNLYLDAGFSQLWGDGSQGTQTLHAKTGIYDIYAYIPPQRLPPAGIYADSVMVVVEW